MKRLSGSVAFACLMLVFHVVAGAGTGANDAAKVKEALQALQPYIGDWKGNGTSEKNKSEIWNEKVSWSWRFKGEQAWLMFDFGKDGKFYRSGEVRYLPDKKVYEVTLLDKKDQRQVFEGRLSGPRKDRLTIERIDPDTKDTHQILLNVAESGIGSVYTYSIKPENRTLYAKQWQVRLTKEGVKFAATKKQTECVVTGGLGTMPVMYKGVTYYVCCTGCRDAFNENPEKILKEYFARRKAGG